MVLFVEAHCNPVLAMFLTRTAQGAAVLQTAHQHAIVSSSPLTDNRESGDTYAGEQAGRAFLSNLRK